MVSEEDPMVAEGNSPEEFQAHEKSYSLFIGVIKWGAIVSLLVTFLVIFIIKA
jgi:hypothetical protein